jgi:hypothetical protein
MRSSDIRDRTATYTCPARIYVALSLSPSLPLSYIFSLHRHIHLPHTPTQIKREAERKRGRERERGWGRQTDRQIHKHARAHTSDIRDRAATYNCPARE